MSVEPNHLYVEKARNQVALDSFLKLGPILYVFNSPQQTRMIFITPPGCEIDVKGTSTVTPYLAYLEIKQRMRLIAPPEVLPEHE